MKRAEKVHAYKNSLLIHFRFMGRHGSSRLPQISLLLSYSLLYRIHNIYTKDIDIVYTAIKNILSATTTLNCYLSCP